MKKIIATTNAPAALGPYSQAVDGGSVLITSGQLGMDSATGELPQGIVCGSNLLAYAFTLAAAERGVAIPGDMLLITFDRYPYSGLISPEPTLVQIDVRDMGRAAAKQLFQGLKKPELRVQSYTTLPSLIEGQSTRKL